VFGVPFDSTSTFRTGSRFGPDAIREAYNNIEIYSKRLGVDLETSNIDDIGNLAHTGDLGTIIRAITEVSKELVKENTVPGILGGEHTLTYGSFLAMPKGTSLLVFDAHLDLREEFADLKLSHATYLRRIVEKDKDLKVFIVGGRAATKKEWEYARLRNIQVLQPPSRKQLEEYVIEFKSMLKSTEQLYVSIDLDVADPSYAPGVGNPEPGGLTSRELLELIYSLKGKKIAGFDIVELNPLMDNGSSAALSAKLLCELCCLQYVD
jgi:agmatinase